MLLDARVALHRATGRPGDTLRLEDQDAAAVAAGAPDADVLMARIAAAARTVAWIADEAWGRVGRPSDGQRDRGRARASCCSTARSSCRRDTDPAVDPTYVLRVATAAARNRARIGRRSLDRLAADIAAVAGDVAGRCASTSWSPCCSRATRRSR